MHKGHASRRRQVHCCSSVKIANCKIYLAVGGIAVRPTGIANCKQGRAPYTIELLIQGRAPCTRELLYTREGALYTIELFIQGFGPIQENCLYKGWACLYKGLALYKRIAYTRDGPLHKRIVYTREGALYTIELFIQGRGPYIQ